MQTEKGKLYERVDFYRNLLGIPLDQPIKLVDILSPYSQFDIEFCNFKTPGLCGVAMVGDKSDTIVLNSNRTSEEQNFDCGHEFLHLAEHRKIQDSFNCFTKTKPQQAPGIQYTLAEYYHVTPQVINIRLDSLSYEIDQYKEGTRLDCLELLSRTQRTRLGIAPTCYQALCDFAFSWDPAIGS